MLDLTRYLPGPYATMLLGDLGADVVKVEEPPIGDPTRGIPPQVWEDSAVHAALNRNKRSVLVDLRDDDGAAVVNALAGRADVLVETYRPGVLARRGLGAAALLAENPRLVYCALSGYGQDGPHAQAAGHEIDYMARGGFLAATRDATGRPVLPLTHVGDMQGALTAVIGILAALQARARKEITRAWDSIAQELVDRRLDVCEIAVHRVYSGPDKKHVAGYVVTGRGSGADDGALAYVRAFDLSGKCVFEKDYAV